MKTSRRAFLKGVSAIGLSAGMLGTADAATSPSPAKVEDSAAGSSSGKGGTKLDLKYVTYCGLYCKLCANLARIPEQASALLATLRNEGWDYFGDKELLKKLQNLSDTDKEFSGCRGGKCGDPGCEIRKCAPGRKVVVCSACKDYPCDKINSLAERYPTLVADGRRQQEIGLENWVDEQEARAKAGFCYADIRISPDRAKLKLACCGLACGACDIKREDCDGCQSNSPRQWSGDCKIRPCCRQRKKLDNCSACSDFPCAIITAFEHDQYQHHKSAVEKLRKMRKSG